MGLLTVDVTGLGVVMTSDRQPIVLGDGSLAVLDLNAQSKELKIIERHAAGFDGLLGYVGTERIGSATVRSVIERINTTRRPTFP